MQNIKRLLVSTLASTMCVCQAVSAGLPVASRPSTGPASEPRLTYTVWYSARRPAGWDDPKAVNASTSNTNTGQVTLLVNGDPTNCLDASDMEFGQVNQWLTDGENTVAVEGHATEPVYITVAVTDEARSPRHPLAICKGVFDLTRQGSTTAPAGGPSTQPDVLRFACHLPEPLPPRDLLAADPAARKRYRRDAEQLASQLEQAVAHHDARTAGDLLTAGTKLWAWPAYGKRLTPDDLNAQIDPKLRLDPTANAKPLNVIFGRRAMLCYREQPGELPGWTDKYIVRATLPPRQDHAAGGPERVKFPAWTVAYVGGKPLVWDRD